MDYAEIYWMIDDQHIFMVLFLLSVTIIFVVKDTVILSLPPNYYNTSGFGLPIFPAGGGPGSAFGMWIFIVIPIVRHKFHSDFNGTP